MANVQDDDLAEEIQERLLANISKSEIARQLGVSRQTVYRVIQKTHMQHFRFTNISDANLTDIMKDIKRDHPNSGAVLLIGHLRRRNIYVQRHRVRKILHDIDSEGVEARRTSAIQRRVYSVPCPNYLWHLDGNHKLIKWKIVIHGGIDGFTRMVVYLSPSPNNKSHTVLSHFLRASREFGMPLRIRTDHGGENTLVWQHMLEKRGESGVLVGSSVHNERIERLWKDVKEKVSSKYIEEFYTLMDENLLDPDNTTDILCLHWVYLPLLQKDLTEHAQAHNYHRLSTEGGMSPYQLLVANRHLTELFLEENTDNPDDAANLDINYDNLPHVQFSIGGNFSMELKTELRLQPVAAHFSEGRAAYLATTESVAHFITQNGHM